MSGSIAKKLRVGIIDKLKEFDCYIDNELPEYIMVLIANKKTSNQMKEDLSLFVGDNVGEFVDWLHICLDKIKQGLDPFVKQLDQAKANVSIVNKDESPRGDDSMKREQQITSKPQVDPSSKAHSSLTTSAITSLTEESKENTTKKQPVSTQRKEITFTDEDKVKFDCKRKNEAQPESPKRSQHKRIVFTSEGDAHQSSNSNGQQQAKRFRTEIKFDSSNFKPTSSEHHHQESNNTHHHHNDRSDTAPIRTRIAGLQSQITVNQAPRQSSNLQSFYKRTVTSSNRSHSPGHNAQSNGNQTNYGPTSNHHNQVYSSHSLANSQRPLGQRSELRHKSPIELSPSVQHHRSPTRPNIVPKIVKKPVRSESVKPKSMFMQALNSANKQSDLPSVSIKNLDSAPLADRLGSASLALKTSEQSTTSKIATTSSSSSEQIKSAKKDDDDENVRKERRLAKFNQKSVVEEKRASVIERINRTEVAVEVVMDGEIHTHGNSAKPDLRDTLNSKKRKSDVVPIDDQNNVAKRRSPPAEKLNPKTFTRKETENDDEELRKLRSKIKPKASVLVENKKDENKKDSDDSDENIDLIINEWKDREKALQATLDEKRNKLKSSSSAASSSVKKERCMYWPVCSNQECQYYHPKAFCVKFPNCKYGANCLNIHPNCKFDSKCINPVCPYTHLVRKLIQPKVKLLSTIQKIPAVVKK